MASAGGGPESCASKNQGLGSEAALQACFNPYKFDKNLIVTGRGSFPKGNITVGSPESAGIHDLKGAVGKDPSSATQKGRAVRRSLPERLPMGVTLERTSTPSRRRLLGWNRGGSLLRRQAPVSIG